MECSALQDLQKHQHSIPVTDPLNSNTAIKSQNTATAMGPQNSTRKSSLEELK